MNDNKKEFFKIYNTSVKILWNLTKNEMRLFLLFCSSMAYGSGQVVLTPPLRKIMAERLSVSRKTLYNAITSLKKKGLVSTSDSVYYYVNQSIAAKGGTR